MVIPTKIELSDVQLKELKSVELKMLCQIDKACRDNGIKYSITGGTLLGAVRHGGFIPWDDDIDILMLRPEYKKFQKIWREILPEQYIFVDAWNNEDYGLTFGKVLDTSTVMKEETIACNNVPAHVFIDVFPIDKTFDDPQKMSRQFKCARRVKTQLLCRGNYYFEQTGIKLWLYRLRGMMLRTVPKNCFLKCYDENIDNSIKSKKMISLNGTNKIEKESFPSYLFDEYIDIDFENCKVMSIKKYDEFLTILYGDYMKLPPEAERIPHHFVVSIKL